MRDSLSFRTASILKQYDEGVLNTVHQGQRTQHRVGLCLYLVQGLGTYIIATTRVTHQKERGKDTRRDPWHPAILMASVEENVVVW